MIVQFRSFHSLIVLLAVLVCGMSANARAGQHVVTVVSQEAGVTPFISLFTVTMTNPAALASYQFIVKPKKGSDTRPVSATYSAAALRARGFVNLDSQVIVLPVFGLYQNRRNTVKLLFRFNNGESQTETLSIHTTASDDAHTKFDVLKARKSGAALSYDFILLKTYDSVNSPLIIDTDGELRWAGTSGVSDGGEGAAAFYQNGIYLGVGTSLLRIELDGETTLRRDLAEAGIIGFHHNIDFGRDGLILDVALPFAIESVNMEVDAKGNVLRQWNLGMILAETMFEGGDDPSGFVQDYCYGDWFHNNATAYRASDDTLLVSSRENFVIALDYDSGEIRWILGDPEKHWADYSTLERYALQLAPGSTAPIGQHALSFDGDRLMLFDNGYPSINQSPAGNSRSYSAPRKYQIDTAGGLATEVWNYPNNESVFSPVCSSVYMDQPDNYLIDYATAGPFLHTEIFGLNHGNKVFDYQYAAPDFCAAGWNAAIVHLEHLVF